MDPYLKFIENILHNGERRIVGKVEDFVESEIGIDEFGKFHKVPFLHGYLSEDSSIESLVKDISLNMKINPSYIIGAGKNETKNITFSFYEKGRKVSLSFYGSSVCLFSGIDEINAITEIPHILATTVLFSCLYYWKNPEMCREQQEKKVFNFSFKFTAPYIRSSEIPLLKKKKDANGLSTLRIVYEGDDVSNISEKDFWIDAETD
ncbi:hypothetical protein IJU97_03150 [bacterium]|nr:hypothetical protein [bacterium]